MRAIALLLACLCAQLSPAQSSSFDKAAGYMLQEKWQAAKDIYDEILKYDADNHTARYYRAYANERLLHYGLARVDYDVILKAYPLDYHALMGRATLNQKDHKLTEAIDDANLLVEHHQDSIDAWVTRATIEEEQGLLALAEYDYEQAYALNPQKTDYILQAIDLKIRQKKKKEAKKQLDKLVKAGIPKNALLYYYKQINPRNP